MAITPCQKMTTVECLMLGGMAIILICTLFGIPDMAVWFTEEDSRPGEDLDPFLYK